MIKSHFPSARLERVKTTNMGTMYELSYRIEMRDVNQEKEFVDELRCRNGILLIVSGTNVILRAKINRGTREGSLQILGS